MKGFNLTIKTFSSKGNLELLNLFIREFYYFSYISKEFLKSMQ